MAKEEEGCCCGEEVAIATKESVLASRAVRLADGRPGIPPCRSLAYALDATREAQVSTALETSAVAMVCLHCCSTEAGRNRGRGDEEIRKVPPAPTCAGLDLELHEETGQVAPVILSCSFFSRGIMQNIRKELN
jgi:hypothetical protein